jgi:hypothetical protein
MGPGSPCGRPGRPGVWPRPCAGGLHGRASRRLSPRRSEENAIRGRARGRAASQSTAACRMSMSSVEAAPLAASRAPRAVLYGVFAVWLRPAGLGGPLPSTKTPPRWNRQAGRKGGSHLCAARSLGLARPFRREDRSPARPHDASRNPLGSGGTGRSISEVFGAGISWRVVPGGTRLRARERRGEPSPGRRGQGEVCEV